MPAQVEKDLKSIESASLHAREIIKKLMTFARQLPPKKAPVNLNDVVNDGLYFFEARCAKAGIQLVRRLAADLPEITVDPGQMNQVLVNLVVNAIQAMPEGGTLTVETRAVEDGICLSVEDTGMGMSEEVEESDLPALLHHQGCRRGNGAGPGGGSRHRHLPRGRDHGRDGGGKRHPVPHPPTAREHRIRSDERRRMKNATEKERILIVDDSPETLEMLERNLSSEGYEVLTAPGVAEAIKILDDTPADLVITDYKMPKISGMDLIRYVRENLKNTEVMMITGYATVEGAVDAIKAGAEEYLTKPFTDEELFSAVRRALDKLRLRMASQDRLPQTISLGTACWVNRSP